MGIWGKVFATIGFSIFLFQSSVASASTTNCKDILGDSDFSGEPDFEALFSALTSKVSSILQKVDINSPEADVFKAYSALLEIAYEDTLALMWVARHPSQHLSDRHELLVYSALYTVLKDRQVVWDDTDKNAIRNSFEFSLKEYVSIIKRMAIYFPAFNAPEIIRDLIVQMRKLNEGKALRNEDSFKSVRPDDYALREDIIEILSIYARDRNNVLIQEDIETPVGLLYRPIFDLNSSGSYMARAKLLYILRNAYGVKAWKAFVINDLRKKIQPVSPDQDVDAAYMIRRDENFFLEADHSVNLREDQLESKIQSWDKARSDFQSLEVDLFGVLAEKESEVSSSLESN